MLLFDYYVELPKHIMTLLPLSFYFIIFVFITFVGCRILKGFFRPIILCLANLLFLYSYAKYHLFSLLLLALYTYIMGWIGSKLKNKLLFFLILIPYIAMFAIYKYGHSLLIPLGYSFVSFKAISYLVDIYNKHINPKQNPLYFLNYLLFFPAVTAGPIHRYQAFHQILEKPQTFDYLEAKNGVFEMFLGIFEKIVFCDFIASLSTRMMTSEMTGWITVLGVILYSFQIYLDFDSYSHISIGCARLLGFSFSKNFSSPYLAVSIADFWRRWHISLGAFFRDYVYIPLGGNRQGKIQKYFCILIVFLLSGLWHGSTFNFLIWGLLHGLLRIIEDMIPIFRKREKGFFILKPFLIVFNFILVTCLWQFFSHTHFYEVIDIFTRMTRSTTGFEQLAITTNEWIWMGIVLICIVIYDIWHDVRDALRDYAKLFFPLRWLGYAILIWIFLIFGVYGGSASVSDFIYKFF